MENLRDDIEEMIDTAKELIEKSYSVIYLSALVNVCFLINLSGT